MCFFKAKENDFGMKIDQVFPELRSELPDFRMKRVENIFNRFFEKTLTFTEDGLPFVITGDIPAMWLRDSTWQVAPFLRSRNQDIGELLADLSIAQFKYFKLDPYANAFNPAPSGACWHKDFEFQSPWVFERKYELDSWASVLLLARRIQEQWGITRHLGPIFEENVNQMILLAEHELNHDAKSYRFFRPNSYPHDSLSHDGFGAPTSYTGMVYSAFRPSDDACTYGYLVPSNLFFLNELKNLPLSLRPTELISKIELGISQYAVSDRGYAYEVDGYGNQLLIDDANLPSLLSLPYLGAVDFGDPVYLKTRERILSTENQFFYSGEFGSGVGSPHTPKNFVWPIAIAIEGLTRPSEESLGDVLELLEQTDAETGHMHESFDINDPTNFTRPWFSWADMMYLEVVLENQYRRSR